MDPKLRKHLLEESRAMLSEARIHLENSLDSLMDTVTEVEQGDYHPLRKDFQRTTVGEDTVKVALKHSSGLMSPAKRSLREVTTDVENVAAQLSKVEVDQAGISSSEEAKLAEQRRIEAERTIERERAELSRLEAEKAALLRAQAEKAEQLRLDAEKALEEERLLLSKLAAEREALRKKVEEERAELEKIEREKAIELERKKKELEERIEREHLEQEQKEKEVLEAKRIAKAEKDRKELETHRIEQDELAARRKLEESQRLERIAKEDEDRKERIAKEEAERKARLEQEELQRKEHFAKEEAEQKERLVMVQREHEERLHALAEAARLEAEAAEAERQALEEMERLEMENQLRQSEAARALANDQHENEEDQALKEALAERAMLERSFVSGEEMQAAEPQGQQQELEVEEEEDNANTSTMQAEAEQESQQPTPASAMDSSFDATKPDVSGGEKKYVTIQDRMLQPRKKGLFFNKPPRERVLVLREDKFRYFDETKTQMLGGLSLAEEGVEVVLTALKKSPSGVALRFFSPSVGTLEFYPVTVDIGKKWIAAIEHNMEMRYELPDLGPEEAMTYYDYLGVPPEHADPPTLLQAYADRSRSAQDEALRAKLNEALQVLHDPFKKVEYDNFVMVQRKYRFGGPATVQIRTVRGEATDAVLSRVFTDANFTCLFWQDIRLGPSLTGRHLLVELARIQEVQPGTSSNAVHLELNNGEVLIFTFQEKREAEDFGAAIRFARSPQHNMARRRMSVQETSV